MMHFIIWLFHPTELEWGNKKQVGRTGTQSMVVNWIWILIEQLASNKETASESIILKLILN